MPIVHADEHARAAVVAVRPGRFVAGGYECAVAVLSGMPDPGPGNGHNGWGLCHLWEHLAAHTADPVQRRRMLVCALRHAEAFADVERIHAALEGAAK